MRGSRRQEARRVSPRHHRLIPFIALLLVTSARPSAAQGPRPISFLPPVSYAKPGASEVEAADVDGDGRVDLVAVGSDGVSIWYGNGDGTFGSPVDYALEAGVRLDNHVHMAVADLNGDGALDLVIPHYGLSKIVVLMNQRDRTFAPAVSYPTGPNPDSVAAVDLNGDGRPDVAVSNDGGNSMGVLLNRGDGALQAAAFYPGADFPGGLVSADFNGDGHLDLAMSSFYSNRGMLYLGDGTGKFPSGGGFNSGGDTPARLVAEDFNGDGKPDLAVANYFGGSVSVLFGDGSGRFSPAINYAAEMYPFTIAATDLDGDGDPDLVLADAHSDGFTVLENTGSGSFLPAMKLLAGGADVRSLAVADFDGDGRPDVAVASDTSGNISVLLNNTPLPTPAIRSLTLDPPSVVGGCDSVTGAVALTAPAPAGGAVVALASSNPAVSVPAQVSVREGALQAQFSVGVSASGTPQWASISASLGATARRASLLIRPMGAPQVTVNPAQVIGGQPAMGHVTITCPAGPDGAAVLLASSSPSVSVPASVTVAAGATTAAFPILTYKVTAATTVTITAGPPGATATATLRVLPPALPPPPAAPAPVSLALFPNPVIGGMLALGQVTLAQPAGPGGALVTLASSSPAAVVVGPIAIPPGVSSTTFPILTFPVSQPTSVTITAGSASGAATATLQLLPLPAPPLLISGMAYVPAGPSETLTAAFTQPDGGVTSGAYKGYVLLHVTGVGQAYGAAYNDAFYLYTAPFAAPQNGHDGGYYQLTFGASPLQAFSLGSNARNFLVGPLPPYNPAHDYTFVLDTRLASPARLHFGVSDGGYNDNSGAYTITATPLVARA
jgi:hypothetical protein